MKIDTKGRDYITGGKVYHAGKDGIVVIPDDVADEAGVKDSDNSGVVDQGELVASLQARVAELEVENTRLAKELEAFQDPERVALVAEALELKVADKHEKPYAKSILERMEMGKIKELVARAKQA